MSAWRLSPLADVGWINFDQIRQIRIAPRSENRHGVMLSPAVSTSSTYDFSFGSFDTLAEAQALYDDLTSSLSADAATGFSVSGNLTVEPTA